MVTVCNQRTRITSEFYNIALIKYTVQTQANHNNNFLKILIQKLNVVNLGISLYIREKDVMMLLKYDTYGFVKSYK